MSPDPAVETWGLSRRFGPVTALDGLGISVAEGTVYGFLGPNGAGKTTTIRLLLGLLEASGGWARVLGLDPRTAGAELRRQCGVLLEHPGLYERLSAEDNLDYFGRLWRIPAGERQLRIVEVLDHVGLADRRTELVGTWSRGMKQKVAIARALLHRPRLVFLDEPTAGLDPVAAAALRNDLLSLVGQEGVTVFLTTHNLDEAQRVCDRVGVVRSGRLVAQGTPDELRSTAGRPTVTVRGSSVDLGLAAVVARPEVAGARIDGDALVVELRSPGPVAPIVRLLVEAGVGIEEVHQGAASLEEAFLALLADPASVAPEPAT
ncbi:MAG TPA: ABC transporter ATP-binding protein [Acidimicrobiales bacterium]